MPEEVAYIEPFRRRVRATKNGRTVIDSEQVLLVHRPGRPPVYAFAAGDVDGLSNVAEPDSPGYVTVDWDDADLPLVAGPAFAAESASDDLVTEADPCVVWCG